MLNAIWAGMMLIAIVGGALMGKGDAVTAALLNGGKNTLTFMLTLGGSMCLWSGVLRVAETAGFTRFVARTIAPLLRLLFPRLPKDSAACRAISMNISANVLGLGNAATPFGLQAMKGLHDRTKSDYATRDMIVLAVLNTASVQLIPTTVAALRAEAGSTSPLSILPAVWITSLGSALAAVTVVRVFGKE